MRLKGTVFAILAIATMWAQNTVAVSGRITDAITGQPIEQAAITLEQGSAGGFHQMFFTDQGGNYSFDEVPPGTGRIQIYKEGYLTLQKTNPDSVAIQIAADHVEYSFKLTPVASITGRIIRQEPDQPGESIVVTLLHEDFSGGVGRFVEVGSTIGAFGIGPDGSFRFTALEPGRYIVSARTTTPPAEISLYCRAEGAGAAQCAEAQRAYDRAKSGSTNGYPVTYYPGTTEFADAPPVTLAAGESRVLDFKVTKRPLFRASGEIELPGGVQRTIMLVVDRANGGGPMSAFRGTVPGQFAIAGLPVGQYTATASVSLMGVEGEISFAITDHDVEGLRIVPQGQIAVNGFFRMANAATKLPAGLSVQFAWPLPGESTPTPASENGHFFLSAFAGDYSVLPMVPAGYVATEVRYAGANYLNRLIPMRGDSPDPSLTIVLTDQPGAVAGSIVDGDQKVATKVVLAPDPLPADFDLWAIRVVSTDATGAFTFSGIAPGRYKAVALTGDDRKRDHDLAILGDKLHAADAFEVAAGQNLSINLRH